jgi:diguanylate cyclase (GGDEF)-like protein
LNLRKPATSLVVRLLAMGLLMAVVGTAASYFQLSRFLRNDLTQSVAVQQEALASYVARDVDNYLGERLSFLERLAASLPPQLLAQPEALRAWLEERDTLSPVFPLGLAVGDTTGRRLDRPGQFAPDSLEFSGALGGHSALGRAHADPVSQNSILSMAVPVRDSAGRVVAVLVGAADLTADGLLDHLQRGRVGQAGGILVVSPRDRMFIASTDTSMSLTPTPALGVNLLHDRAMQGYRGSGTTRNARGVDEISAIASVPNSGWFVVARLPVAEALAPVGRMQDFILRQRVVAVAVVLVLIGMVMAWLLRPLFRAASQADRMTRGEIELAPLQVVRDDEIGHLTQAFNRLLAKLVDNQAALARLAHHDSLTGLPNRKLLDDRLHQALVRARRRAHHVAVLYLDLDGFKALNDTLGHEAGDEALREIARRLLGLVRQTDTVARIGGDEFVLLAADFEGPAEQGALILARRCIEAIAQPLRLRGVDMAMGVSIGIALGNGAETPPDLLAAADKAMYQAKQNGRGSHVVAPARPRPSRDSRDSRDSDSASSLPSPLPSLSPPPPAPEGSEPPPAFETRSQSPDGRYALQVAPWEAGHSHWVMAPRILDTRTGKVVFQLADPRWSAEHATWEADAEVRLELRKYPGDQPRPGLVARLDCQRELGRIDNGDAVPLALLEPAAEQALVTPA